MCFAAQFLQQDLLRIKLNPKKKPRWSYPQGSYSPEKQNPTYNDESLKVYPLVKFLGITFDSQLSFKKHFEDILDHCNTKYHRLRLLANKKWGPSLSTLIQIYKQCVRPNFEYGSISTIIVSDYIISKLQPLQNTFIRLALRLPKYIYSACPSFTKIHLF